MMASWWRCTTFDSSSAFKVSCAVLNIGRGGCELWCSIFGWEVNSPIPLHSLNSRWEAYSTVPKGQGAAASRRCQNNIYFEWRVIFSMRPSQWNGDTWKIPPEIIILRWSCSPMGAVYQLINCVHIHDVEAEVQDRYCSFLPWRSEGYKDEDRTWHVSLSFIVFIMGQDF
jgi:hypothetical protein